MVHSFGQQTALKRTAHTALRNARLVEKENLDLMRLHFESDVDLHCLVRTCALGLHIYLDVIHSINLHS